MTESAASEQRVTPYYCPYCGDEDLRPDAPDGTALPSGTWRCGECSRVFGLRYAGAGHAATSQSKEVS